MLPPAGLELTDQELTANDFSNWTFDAEHLLPNRSPNHADVLAQDNPLPVVLTDGRGGCQTVVGRIEEKTPQRGFLFCSAFAVQ